MSAAATATTPSHSAGSGSFAEFHVSPAAAANATAEGITEVSKSLRVSLSHLRWSSNTAFKVPNDWQLWVADANGWKAYALQ